MDDNIFDAAAKQSKHVKKGKRSETVAQASDLPASTPTEVISMLKKLKDMREDLENKLSTLYQKGKEAHVDVDLFFGDTYKMTAKDIENIKSQERQLIERLNAITPPESCIRKPEKSKEKLTQERKGKFRGARQKWIPIK